MPFETGSTSVSVIAAAKAASPGGDVDLPDMAFRPNHQVLAVRRPSVIGINTEDGPRLLLIFAQAVVKRHLFAGLQIIQIKNALQTHTPHEGEIFAVRRRLWTSR